MKPRSIARLTETLVKAVLYLRSRPWWTPATLDVAVATLVALSIFKITLGFKVVNPLFIDWCLHYDSDLAINFISWTYYRYAPWSFPAVTGMDNIYYPAGASLLNTDSLPLFGVPLKLLRSLLPARVQYLGVWLLISHWLQAYLSLRLLRVLGVSRLLSWLGCVVLGAAAPMIIRYGHSQLAAHWMVIAGLLAVCRKEPTRSIYLLPVLALWVHPYFFPMTLAFSLIAQIQFRKQRRVWLKFAAMLLGILLSLVLVGYFAMRETRGMGFEMYVTDLSAFFNSGGTSSLLPSWPVSKGSTFEGFAYLGAGGLLLAGCLTIGLCVPSVRRRVFDRPVLWWVSLVCLGFALFAISASPHWLGERLFRIEWLSHVFEPIGTRFRANGRFMWPFFYLLLALGFKALHELTAGRARLQLIGVGVLAVQMLDLGPWMWKSGQNQFLSAKVQLPDVPRAIRQQLKDETRFFVFWPPVAARCNNDKWTVPYFHLALFAAENGLTTNADLGLARRADVDRRAVCRFSLQMVRNRRRHPEAIVVTEKQAIE